MAVTTDAHAAEPQPAAVHLGESWTTKRARLNALQRHRSPGDPEVEAARRELREARATEYIKRLVDDAPPLTPEQRDRLALLLRGGSTPA